MSKIEKRLQMKRVLIVLDDIDKHAELCTLFGTNAVPYTKQDHNYNQSCSTSLARISILLNDHESLQLLNYHECDIIFS